MPGLLGIRRAARQGGRLCRSGAGRNLHRTPQRQLFWGDGTAIVRNSAAAARGRDCLPAGAHPGREPAMSVEILVNVAPREMRAAILENGVVQEIYIERASRRGLVSNLYKGRVSRVLPGMQAAFVEIGLQRTAFLHAADIAGKSAAD